MASINTIRDTAVAIYKQTPHAVLMAHGKPGMGKSDMTLQVAEALGIPEDRVLRVHVNNHDVVDFTGVPSIVDGETIFNPTQMFHQFREGTGPAFIVFEEAAQSSQQMQTWLAGFVLDRCTTEYKLDPQVRIMCTGNRVEDKAGAKALLSHLNDRMFHFDVDDSLDDWCEWAMNNGVEHLGIAFLRLRPQLLNDFDPARRSNPTQRSWTAVFKEIPTTLDTNSYFEAVKGRVGEGAAAEWVAARDLMSKMPSVDVIRLQPEKTEVPDEPAVKYAVATALSMTTEPESFDRDMIYVGRMPKEFQMVYVTDALRLNPKLQSTKPFIDWAIANKDIFMGGN